jgi:hypothetical protein
MVRAATFEVVLPKPVQDTLTYEKPLPLDLIPYAERIDQHWSVGSAFAVGPNAFVTASHVLMSGLGRRAGPPALRDSSGALHVIDRILHYSDSQDFVVFSLVHAPPGLVPLQTTSEFAIDDAVYAVGNAFGEGVVIRDGLLTSLTPEARSARWQWLRFSAATSPGNSGGPLVDAAGRVLGVVVAKSPNENLNFALPIARVLEAGKPRAEFESFEPFRLPVLRDAALVDFRREVALPLTYAEFATRALEIRREAFAASEKALLTEQASVLFPRGRTDEFVATAHLRLDPSLLAQQEDGRWGLLDTGYDYETTLPGGTRVWVSRDPRVSLFRIVLAEGTPRPDESDGQAFMDLLAKGFGFRRMVGTETIRITSLGPAIATSVHEDAFRRRWLVRTWAMDALETQIVVLSLPTPDGYVGMAMQNLPGAIEVTKLQLQRLADYFFLSMTGSLAQWRAFLARPDLGKGTLDQVSISLAQSDGVHVRAPGLEMKVPTGVMAVTDASRLDLRMSFVPDGNERAAWRVVGVRLQRNAGKSDSVDVRRQARPSGDASESLRERWSDMTARTGDYVGEVRRDEEAGEYWFRAVIEPKGGNGDVLHELRYATRDRLMPVELGMRRERLLQGLKAEER